MANFTAHPAEVLLSIFQSCADFRDVLALASTCKQLYSIWSHENGSIIWHVGHQDMLCFDEALITVRATEVAKDAFLETRLAPPTDIHSLSGSARKPAISELKEVLNLRHYVCYLQHVLFLPENAKTLFNDDGEFLSSLSPHGHLALVEKFHRAIYQYFIAGAIVSREFLKPMYDASEQNLRTKEYSDKYFMGIANRIENQGRDWDTAIKELDPVYDWTEGERMFMNEYPAYHFTESARWEECFGGFAKWLIKDTKKRNGADEEGNLRDVLRLLFVFGQMADGGVLGVGGKPFWDVTRMGCTCDAQQWEAQERRRRNEENGQEDDDSDEESIGEPGLRLSYDRWHGQGKYIPIEDVDPAYFEIAEAEDENAQMGQRDRAGEREWMITTRKINLINLCAFTPTTIAITSGPRFTQHTSCTHREVRLDNSKYTHFSNVPTIPDMCDFLEILHCMTYIPNHIETGVPGELHFAPHPPLHLFSYVLREYFGYQFADDAFEVKGTVGTYEAFIGDARILGNEGNWDALLVSKDVKHHFVYEERKFSECFAPSGGW